MNIIPRTIGIYQITCSTNGKIYIGSSINIERRWQAHLAALCRGDHSNPHLQNAWNKHGTSTFFWEILEVCDADMLPQLEQFYLETRYPFQKHGFNISLDTKSNMRGRKHTPESIKKMSVNRIKKPLSDAHKAAVSAYHKGRPHSPEHAAKIGEANRKRVYSDETKEKLRIAATNMSQKQRDQIAAKRSQSWVVTTPDGVEIEITNLEQFCRENGIHPSGMRSVAYGLYSQHKRWLCRHA